jgi:tyrosyl-tRNA synthetase
MIQQGGLSVNKEKISDQNAIIGSEQVLNGKYVLLQKGRKSYCLVRVV